MRAKKTAVEITRLCDDVPVQMDSRLREMHLGCFQGLTVGEIFQNQALARHYTEFNNTEDVCAPEGGERYGY